MKKIILIFIIIISILSCNKNQKKISEKKITKKDIPELMKNIEKKIENRKKKDMQNYWINSESGLELRNINSHNKILIIPKGEKVKLIKAGDSYLNVDGIIDIWDVIEWNGKKGLVLSKFLQNKNINRSLNTDLCGKWVNEKQLYYIEFKEDSTFITNENGKDQKNNKKWKYNKNKRLIKINTDNKEDEVQLYYVASINHYKNGLIKEISLLDLKNGGIKEYTCSTTPIHEAVINNDLEKFIELTHSNDDFMIEAAYGIQSAHLAAKNGNMKIIEYMNEKSDYYYLFKDRTDKGESMLHFAVLGGHSEIIDFLITKELNINKNDDGGYTPLHYAVILGNKELVVKLIEEGADIAKTNRNGNSPAQLAVLYKQPDILKTLLYYGSDPGYSNNNIRDSLLHMCFYSYKRKMPKNDKKKYKNPELPDIPQYNENEIINMFKILMDNSIEIDIKNKDDQTILHYAAMEASGSILNKIYEFDTDYKLDFDGMDNHDFTPVHYAALYNNIEALKFFISKGANVNPNKGYETPLWVALDNTSDEAADILVNNGADLLHNYYDEKSLLHKAVYYKKLKIIKGLVKRGADINYKDDYGNTPLNYAVQENKTDAVKTLLELKADVKIKNNKGNTPLHTASEEYKEEILKLLIEHFKDVNIKNKDGNTPLHLAAVNGRADNVKILLEAGAKINIKNNDGQNVDEYVESSRLYSDKKRKIKKIIEEESKKEKY